MNDLLEKRSRQARRLLRVCLRPIQTECIQRYVDAYEAGTLEHGKYSLCAIGSMSGKCYDEWMSNRRSPHIRESVHIESIFEGYNEWRGFSEEGRRAEDAHRRRWIYSACVAEIAYRNLGTTDVETHEARAIPVCA